MITTLGYKELLENLVLPTPDTSPVITGIRVGDGTTAPSIGDTDLVGTNKMTFPVTLKTSTAGTKGFSAIVPFDKMNSVTLSEIGLMTKTGVLFSRQVLPVEQRVAKTLEMQIEIYWEVNV